MKKRNMQPHRNTAKTTSSKLQITDSYEPSTDLVRTTTVMPSVDWIAYLAYDFNGPTASQFQPTK